MVVIPAGHFLMGSSDAATKRDLAIVPPDNPGLLTWLGLDTRSRASKLFSYEHPQHPVTIARDFALGKDLVTKSEYSVFVRETGYWTEPCWNENRRGRSAGPSNRWSDPWFDQTDRDPVVCISWSDAKAYILWLNGKINGAGPRPKDGPYRLPTEAELEYAIRAGTQTARWWGDGIGGNHAKCMDCDAATNRLVPAISDGRIVMIYPRCCGSSYEKKTVPVDRFPPNPFGLYDALGNAEQWAEDCWMDSYLNAPSDGSPHEKEGCTTRVVRGASWLSVSWHSRSAVRLWHDSYSGSNSIGFRVAKTLQ
ncbi:formylglycine-generating enzyme family protein [Acidisphaera sp. S103]|uniref:formylglycine-generating enzyme family protein n=1 Tax=Acidisphaera sp. S103 TaxID=1747223 RepID=UPI00131B76A8|nr:formylglycine-generating enzyme family protein [Acidisphaera sp. S103]